MKILTCEQYNQEEMQLYEERVEEWRKEDSYNIIPQLMFFGFRNMATGRLKNYGYVLSSENNARWFKTKKEALNYNNK